MHRIVHLPAFSCRLARSSIRPMNPSHTASICNRNQNPLHYLLLSRFSARSTENRKKTEMAKNRGDIEWGRPAAATEPARPRRSTFRKNTTFANRESIASCVAACTRSPRARLLGPLHLGESAIFTVQLHQVLRLWAQRQVVKARLRATHYARHFYMSFGRILGQRSLLNKQSILSTC